MQEHEAIARLKHGDIAGLDVLVRQYQYQAVRAATLVIRDRTAAEDVVQSAFLRIVSRIHQFDSQRPFGPWFLRIVLNDALKEAQRRERYTSLDQTSDAGMTPLDLLLAEACGPELILEQGETREAVVNALNQLTPLQRAAIVQRYYLGMSEAEMARDSAASAGAIKLRLFGA
ncbi:MAG: sigma-70 family RNA polymerase sigma factor, partial [Chloroflexi bacterium]|nr:sigma-70 family RNA polymerase sigma factor [Chloroflexota bacterium]